VNLPLKLKPPANFRLGEGEQMRRWIVLALLLAFALSIFAWLWCSRTRHQIVVVEGSVPTGGTVEKVCLTDLDRDGQNEAIVFVSAPHKGSPRFAFFIEMQNGRFVVTKLPEAAEPYFKSFSPRIQVSRVEAYLTPQKEVVMVTKSEKGNLIVQTISQNAASVVAGDWDKDGIVEEVLVAIGSDGKELRLFKKQPDGMMKQIAVGKLTPQDPPTVALLEEDLLLQGYMPGRLQVRPLEIRGDKIVALSFQDFQDLSRLLLRADLDNDGELDEVRLRYVKGKRSIVVRGKKISAEIPLGEFPEVKAEPLTKNDRRKALFCFMKNGSRWRLQVWDFQSERQGRKLADVSGEWGFTPTKVMPRFVDLDGDSRIDVIVEADQIQPQQLLRRARLVLRQTEKGWEARVEQEKILHYGINPFVIVGDSPVWLIRSVPRQVKVVTLTYIRPHMKTVWETEVFVMGKDGKWKRKGKLAGRGVAAFSEKMEFADTNDDGVPEIVTVRPDLLDFERVFFWWFTPKKGWQGIEFGPAGRQQIAYFARNGSPINITVVFPVNWDGQLWLTIFCSDGTIKAVRAPKVNVD
jgi:hypothetical protein